MAANHAHHQARACPRIAEIQHLFGRTQPANTDATHPPMALAEPVDLCAERAAGIRCAEHIIALEQAGDHRLANAEQPENHRPMRNRFVAGQGDCARQSTCTARGEGLGSAGMAIRHETRPADWKNNSTRRRAASRHAPLAQDAEGVITEDTPHHAIMRKMRFPFDSGRTRD